MSINANLYLVGERANKKEFIRSICGLRSVVDFYKGWVTLSCTKFGISLLRKYSTTSSKFDRFEHIAFYDDDKQLIFGIVVDSLSEENEVVSVEYPEKGEIGYFNSFKGDIIALDLVPSKDYVIVIHARK